MHPFSAYRAAGVPTVLSTDDEGVERIDRTHELQRAVTEFGLDWQTLVGLERNTLEYGFVAGASLWADPGGWRRVAACGKIPISPVRVPHVPRSCRAAKRRSCNGNWSATWTGSAASRDADGFRSAEPILQHGGVGWVERSDTDSPNAHELPCFPFRVIML